MSAPRPPTSNAGSSTPPPAPDPTSCPALAWKKLSPPSGVAADPGSPIAAAPPSLDRNESLLGRRRRRAHDDADGFWNGVDHRRGVDGYRGGGRRRALDPGAGELARLARIGR